MCRSLGSLMCGMYFTMFFYVLAGQKLFNYYCGWGSIDIAGHINPYNRGLVYAMALAYAPSVNFIFIVVL